MFNKIMVYLKHESKYYYLKFMNPQKYKRFLEKEYKLRTNENVDFNNPKKYTEKMQLAKLYFSTPLKTHLSDKYKVREWITDKIGEEYLIPLLGVWNNYSEIDFGKLPTKFVLKTNHGAGWNLIVNNKEKINHKRENFRFSRWLKKNFSYNGDLQLHYKDIEPKIIAEKFIQDKNGELPEYKFFCFDGEVHYCWEIVGRGKKEYRNIYDTNWNLQDWTFTGHENSPSETEKPNNFEDMVEIARKLSTDFPHVRVDLYNIDGKIYFGEMTFTSTGGYRLPIPEKYNYILGDLWDINKESSKTK